jgi:hypothetical protein
MNKKITIDNQEFICNKSLLPCFINGHEKSWASYFSINLISELIQHKNKIIFFTAFPAAREELVKQIWNNSIFDIDENTNIGNIPTDKSLIIKSGDVLLLKTILEEITHINKYIIFIKNLERYDQHILEITKGMNNIVFSWDYDQCISKHNITIREWNSIITFTRPSTGMYDNVPILQQYESYFISKQKQGILRLQ